MIIIKNIKAETCETCGAKPTNEESTTTAGLLYEARQFSCGRRIAWSQNPDRCYEWQCPHHASEILKKKSRVDTLVQLLALVAKSPLGERDRSEIADRIRGTWWTIKESDLR